MKWLALAALLVAAGCGAPPVEMSDWERAREAQLAPTEEDVLPPDYPQRARLIQFYVSATVGFRFFIDPDSLVVTKQGVVRYVLVALSDSGAENVRYEGLRCGAREVRLYAVGSGGRWTGHATEWRQIESRSVQRWHNELYRRFLCAGDKPVASVQDAISALREYGMQPPPNDL